MKLSVHLFFAGIAALVLAESNIASADGNAPYSSTSASFDQDVQALASPNGNDRSSASERLLKAAKDAVPALLKGLDDSRQEVKSQSLWVLRQIKSLDNDAVAASIGNKARSESDRGLRLQMVQALRGLHGAVAIRELKFLATSDKDEEVRWLATHHVGRLSRNENQFFKTQTSDPSRLVRLAAYTELANLGDKSGRDLALKTIKESAKDNERLEGIRVLGATGNPDDMSLLKTIGSAKEGHNYMRIEALNARKHIELLQLPESKRLSFLVQCLDDRSPAIRDWAHDELYESQDPNTNVALKKYLSEPGHIGYRDASKALNAR